MEVRLDGKVAIVTGATQGIGEAIAEVLAESGIEGLLLTGRDEARGQEVAHRLSAAGVAASFVAADLAETGSPDKIVSACLTRFGRIDCLVNAAGLTNRASVAGGTPGDWELLFGVNARAPFFLMQGAINAMRLRGRGGSIVNVLSINAHCGTPELAIYAATKAALAILTRNAADAHRFDRIRVNGINMGWAETPAEMKMQSEVLGKGPAWVDAANQALPFGKLLQPREVANLAVLLLSDAAGPMTGALIDQDQQVIGANR